VLLSFKFVTGADVKVILLIEEVFKPNQKVNHAKTTDASRPITKRTFHVLNKCTEIDFAVVEPVLIVA